MAFELANRYSTTEWSSDELRLLVSKLIETTKENVFNLISYAYSSININELASLLCLTVDQIVQIAREREWSLDDTQQYFIPRKEGK